MENFLFQASIYLGAAAIAVPLAVRAGLGSVLGYLAAGIVIGQVLGLTGSETAELQHFAEFGVVLMLFLIGMELEPKSLWDMRSKLLGLGGAQVVITMAAVILFFRLFDLSWSVAILAGMIASLSSTAIVLQTLSEKNLMRTPGGRSAFSVLLTQDLAVIPMLAFVPLLVLPELIATPAIDIGITNPESKVAQANQAVEPLMTLIQSLPAWAATLVTLATIAIVVLGGHYLSRPIFRFVHGAKLPEMSTAISLLMVLGIAFLMMLVGLSPALGTFIAGVVLANSEFRHQIEADIRPFKGLLLGLFFMTVGTGVDFGVLAREPLLIFGLTIGLMALKFGILWGISLVFKMRSRDRWLFALSLAQSGEFGFLLVSIARSEGALALAAGQIALLVISLSMLLTPLLFILYERVSARIAKPVNPDADLITEKGKVIIAGVGRFGQVVNRLVRHSGIPTVVLDQDPALIAILARFGVKGFVGDPSRPELLNAAGIDEAQVLVITLDDREKALQIVRYARQLRPDLHIIARARDRVHVYELHKAGVNDTVRELFDSSVRAGRYVLENMGFSEYEAAKLSQTFWRMDRAAMRELSDHWVPGQANHENDAYVARSRELEEMMQAELQDALFETEAMTAEDTPDQPAATPASAKVAIPE
jgi:CPA2 family monovalent cation:H+ antiporter-2